MCERERDLGILKKKYIKKNVKTMGCFPLAGVGFVETAGGPFYYIGVISDQRSSGSLSRHANILQPP